MRGFWSVPRPSAALATSEPITPTEDAAAEAVELYTADELVTGFVPARAQRLSDILNSAVSLLVLRPKRTDLREGGAQEVDATSMALPTSEILLAMPPQWISNPQLRVHHRRSRVRILTGRYEVVGSAHHLPGTTLDPYVLRTRIRFIAVTDATLRTTRQPWIERSAPVVLVNVGPIQELEQVITVA